MPSNDLEQFLFGDQATQEPTGTPEPQPGGLEAFLFPNGGATQAQQTQGDVRSLEAALGFKETPESLFNLAKSYPRDAAGFTDEQVDMVVEHMLDKGLDVTEIPSAAKQAFGQAVVDVTSGIGAGIADYIESGGDTVTPTLRQLGSAADGVIRGGADLAILGKQAAFRNALTGAGDSMVAGRTRRSTSPGERGDRRRQSTPQEPQAQSYAERPEEVKAGIRNEFRSLQRVLADRAETIENGESYLADIATAITGNSDFGDAVSRMILPESAEAYSYFLGPEGVAAGGVRKVASKMGVDMTQGALGKNLIQEAEKATLKGAEKTLEGVSKAVDFGKRKASEVAEGVNKSIPGVEARANSLSRGLQKAAETVRAFREQYGNSTGQTALARIARDANSPEYLQSFATMLTHDSRYAKLLGPGVAMLAKPLTGVLRMARSAGRSGASGALLALPTWDGETIGGAIGSAAALGGAMDPVGRIDFGNRQRIEQRAQKWLADQPDFVREAFGSRFSNDEIARLPVFVEMVNGVLRGSNAQNDAEVFFTNSQRFNQDLATLKEKFDLAFEQGSPLDAQNFLEKQRKNTEADALVSPTRGVQLLATRAKGLKPVLLINVDTATPSTIIHEGMHALSRFGDFNGEMGNLREVLFDQRHPDGTEISNGMIPDTEVAQSFENYAKQLPEDQRAALNAQLDTPEKRLAYMKEEILADSVEAFVMDKPPLYVDDMTGFVHAGLEPLARRLGLTAEFLAGTRPARGRLTQHPEWNRSGLDPRYYNSPEFDSAVKDLLKAGRKLHFHKAGDARKGIRKGSRVRRTLSDDDQFVTIKPKTIKKGTKLAKQFEASLLFDGYDADGNLKLINDIKRIKEREKERKEVLRGLFIAQGPEPVRYNDALPSKEPMVMDPETREMVGDYIGQNIMAQLKVRAEEGSFPMPLYESLDAMNEAMRRGRMLEIDYNPRLNRQRKYDSRLSSTLRIVLPYSFRITKAGNFTFNTLDMGHLAEKFQRKKQQNRLAKLWGGDWDAFSGDLARYIQNTIDSPRDLAVNGISREKANVLSAFLGFRVRRGQPLMNNAAGAQAELFNEVNTDGQSDNLIRTRRVDAINSVKPAGQFEVFPLTPAGRETIQQNFEPDPEATSISNPKAVTRKGRDLARKLGELESRRKVYSNSIEKEFKKAAGSGVSEETVKQRIRSRLMESIDEETSLMRQIESLGDIETGLRAEGLHFVGDFKNQYELPPSLKKSREEALAWVSKKVNPKVLPRPSKATYYNGLMGIEGRAIYDPNYESIVLNLSSPSSVIVHEFGHHLENTNPHIREMAKEFVLMRRESEDTFKLSELLNNDLYGDSEIAYKGNFIHPYVGTVYPSGLTEVISMGLEWMFKDPYGFLQKDPDHFMLIIQAIHGHE